MLIYLLFSVLLVQCYADYVHYPEVEMYYKFHRNPLTWYNAISTCRNEGATLAMPKNEAEAGVLKKILGMYPSGVLGNVVHKDFILLGFHDIFNEGEYITENGHSIQYYFHNWAGGQPDNAGNEDCGSLHRNGNLNDFPCSVPGVFVCQKHASDPITFLDFKCLSPDPAYQLASNLNKCYKLHLNPKTWADARTICIAEGGHLAVINSVEEEKYLLNLFNDPKKRVNHVVHKDYVLLGFHDMFQESHFMTVTGNKLENSGYVNWAPGQPDNAGGAENCGSMTRQGTLNDFPCSIPAVFICEHKANGLNFDTML